MIKKERAARIAAENRIVAIQQQREAERRQEEVERRQADAERRAFLAAELRAERQFFLATLAAERRQAAEERLQLMGIINELIAQQRNR